MTKLSSESVLGSWDAARPSPRNWFARFRRVAQVSKTLVLIMFVALVVVSAAPVGLLPHLMLIPSRMAMPWSWYRLLTYGIVQASLVNWLMVSVIILASGWIAERWLPRRTLWLAAALAALSSGVIYTILAPVGRPLIGGGFIAAGFAGVAVVSCAAHRHDASRGTQLVALGLLLMYGLTPLRPNPESVAMFGAFVVAGVYAGFQLRASRRAPLDQSILAERV
jgi:membrane associated rhomboid family serine protease